MHSGRYEDRLDVFPLPRRVDVSGAGGAQASDKVATGRSTRPEIALFGEWNTTNLGDRAIHLGALEFLAECGWRASSYAIGSLTPVVPASTHNSATTRPRALYTVLNAAPLLKRALRGIRQRARARALLPSLENAQAIMVGGGSLLADIRLHFAQSLVVIADAARQLDKPLVCLGCGADDTWSRRCERMMGEFLAQCSVVAAREQATAERIARVLGRPIPVFGDFAMSEHWALTNGDIGAERHVLAINVQLVSSLSTEQAEYEDALLSVVRRLMRHGLGGRVKQVCIFTTGSDGDLIPARRVCDRLGHDRVDLETPNSLDQLSSTLRRSVAVVASRLHAALLACNEGALVVGLSPHSKIRNVFSTLGLGDYTFDLAARDQLVEQLCDTDLDTTMAIQRRAVMAAPIWDGRAQARSELKALAAARGGSN